MERIYMYVTYEVLLIGNLSILDFLEQAANLYKSLDMQNNDQADKVICDTLSVQLQRAVDVDSSEASG